MTTTFRAVAKKTRTERSLERKLLALQIDMAGECTNEAFLAMCERYDDLDEQLRAIAATRAWEAAYERN